MSDLLDHAQALGRISALTQQVDELNVIRRQQLQKIADLGQQLCDEHDRLREALADRDRARAIAVALEQELAQVVPVPFLGEAR